MLIDVSGRFVKIVMISPLLLCCVTACVTGQISDKPEAKNLPLKEQNSSISTSTHLPGPWFSGSVDDAFLAAKKNNKPLFIYWGAKWCPPCNELKSSVFVHSEFQEALKSVVAVYLDGDEEKAQIWGEKLKVSGYPTLLFLSPAGEELHRIQTGISLDEFLLVFRTSLAQDRPVAQLVEKAKNNKASAEDLRSLAYLSWEQTEAYAELTGEKLKIISSLIEKYPSSMQAEKAIMIARFLELGAQAAKHEDKELQKLAQELQLKGSEYLHQILNSPVYSRSARSTLVFSISLVFPWATKNLSAKNMEQTKKMWLERVHSFYDDPSLSLEFRVWAHFAPAEFYKLSVKKSEDPKNNATEKKAVIFPTKMQEVIVDRVLQLEKLAQSSFERQSVVPSVADVLYQLDKKEMAKTVLIKEAAVSESPFYFYSDLAAYAKEEGKQIEALNWAKKARESATGRATKIQWLAMDLNLNLDLNKDKKNLPSIKSLLRDYYQLAYSLNDGFSGRSLRSSMRIAKKIKPLLSQDQEVKNIVMEFLKNCRQISAKENNAQCKQHFTELGVW